MRQITFQLELSCRRRENLQYFFVRSGSKIHIKIAKVKSFATVLTYFFVLNF